MKIKEITNQQYEEMLDTRKPIGLFYKTDSTSDPDTNLYIAIDNSTGDMWTEEFDTLGDCVDWLLDD